MGRIAIDLTGQQFGLWRVLEKTEERTSSGDVKWLCECSCEQHTQKIISAHSLRSGRSKSCGCISKKSIKDISGEIYGNLEVLKEHFRENNKTYWKCQCQCGNEEFIKLDFLREGKRICCSNCLNNLSRGEYEIKKILDENNIPYKREYTFQDLRDKQLLRFDFAIFIGKDFYLIEFDGKQHFDKTSMFYREELYNHDLLKQEYCIKNNIPLIRIPYDRLGKITLQDLLLSTSNYLYKGELSTS